MENKVTKVGIHAKIKSTVFHKIGEKTTLCVITMQNGFEVLGESSCVDPANFVQSIGESIAYENAFEKLWPLEGYLLQEKLMLKAKFEERNKGWVIHPDEALNYNVLDEVHKEKITNDLLGIASKL